VYQQIPKPELNPSNLIRGIHHIHPPIKSSKIIKSMASKASASKQSATAFDAFIKQRYSKKGEQHTHTRIGSEKLGISGGTYTVKSEDIGEFYKKYTDHVFMQGRHEFLTEKQLVDNGPGLIDIDERYAPAVESRQHTKEHISNLVETIIDQLSDMVVLAPGTLLPIFVFEKPDVNLLEDTTKDGVHILIGMKMDRALQMMLRKRLLTQMPTIWGDLPLTNSWEDVLDEGIVRGTTNWQLYGSRKPGHQAYVLKYWYVMSLDEECTLGFHERSVSIFDVRVNFQLLTAQYAYHSGFEIAEAVKDEHTAMKQSIAGPKQRRVKAPTAAAAATGADDDSAGEKKVVFQPPHVEIIQLSDITDEAKLNAAIEQMYSSIEQRAYELRETHEYTMCLPAAYYDSEPKWIRVGWALRNTSPHLFLTWMAFSAKSTKFAYSMIIEFYDKWQQFGMNTPADGRCLTKRSIMFWAKTDAREAYEDIRRKTNEYYMEETMKTKEATDVDLAHVVFNYAKDKFVCVSIKNNAWFSFNGQRWEECDSGNALRLMISKDIYTMYHTKQIENTSLMNQQDPGSDEWKDKSMRAEKYTEICMRLKTTTFKNNIMKEARELFYDKNFVDTLDTNAYLMCFSNGVVDFSEKRFRRGQPDDNISKCTNIDYVPLDRAKHANTIAEINDFMAQLFPLEELRTYMWDHLASCLIGVNREQTFQIYVGAGSNGKSKLTELMSRCFGEYKATVPITLITNKRNGIGGTSSEIAQLMGIRYAVMQEPSKGDQINEGVLKEVSAGDPLQGRALYKDMVTFIPQFKLVVCTNTMFEIKSNDDGTWRRIQKVDFMSKFCDEPNPQGDVDNPYQFKIDRMLDEKLKRWAPTFMSMLVEHVFKTNGLVKPCSMVTASSQKYRLGQDYLAEFARDKIKMQQGGRGIKKTELYETFKQWYVRGHGRDVPKGAEVYEYMDKKFGKYTNGVWRNVAIIYDDDQEETAEEVGE
jgi:P4 family phage/plasmid primase-like protien